MTRDCSGAIFDVMNDVYFLRKFAKFQVITRGVWDAASAALRKRMMDQGYVIVEENRVRLTHAGLQIIGYREAMA